MNVPVSIGYMDFMTNVSEFEETTLIRYIMKVKKYYQSEIVLLRIKMGLLALLKLHLEYPFIL